MRSAWIEKWLRLQLRHPSLKSACNLIYTFCASYAKTPQAGRMLVMVGENGSGKTHIAKAVVRWANLVAPKLPLVNGGTNSKIPDAMYANWPTICNEFKVGEYEIVDDMMACSLLVLDDIGAEHDPSRVGVDKLCQVLSRRERMWTIVTTNVKTGSWASKFDRRVSSRLFRNSTIIDMSDVPDYFATK